MEYTLELNKKKYKKAEVEAIITGYTNTFQQQKNEYEQRILELELDLKNTNQELLVYKEKEESISNALISAEKNVKESQDKLRIQYSLEVEKLKSFSKAIKGYFDYVLNKYPHYNAVKQANETYKKINELLANDDPVEAVNNVKTYFEKNGLSAKNQTFNPKSKIEEYVLATSDSGFDMNEVLNPGKLELEELCKELGLIDE